MPVPSRLPANRQTTAGAGAHTAAHDLAEQTVNDLIDLVGAEFGAGTIDSRLDAVEASVAALAAGAVVSHPSWSSSTTYPAGVFVRHQERTWRTLRSNVNVFPVEGADWTLFAGLPRRLHVLLPGDADLDVGTLNVGDLLFDFRG